MDMPLLSHAGAKEQLKKLFTRVCFNEVCGQWWLCACDVYGITGKVSFVFQVLEKVEVWESIANKKQGHRHRPYKIKFSFLPHEYYKVRKNGILDYYLPTTFLLVCLHRMSLWCHREVFWLTWKVFS